MDPRELAELGRLPSHKVEAALDAGDFDGALALCEALPKEYVLMHKGLRLVVEILLAYNEEVFRREQARITEEIKAAKPDPKADAKARAAKAAASKTRPAASDATPEPIRRRTHIVLEGLAPSLLEVGRWMTALERVPVFSAVRLELMEEKAIDGLKLSEFRIAIRMEPDADLRGWEQLDIFREGRLPDEFASSIGEVGPEATEAQR